MFANRPLNARTSIGTLRIATYQEDIKELNEQRDSQIFDATVTLIHERLRFLGLSDDPMDFTIIKLLHENWMKFDNPDIVKELFHGLLYPFLYRIYQGQAPLHAQEAFAKLYKYALMYSKTLMTRHALDFRKQMVGAGYIKPGDDRALALIACESYLAAGIDHVLVGMRTVSYVDDLKSLLSPRPTRTSVE